MNKNHDSRERPCALGGPVPIVNVEMRENMDLACLLSIPPTGSQYAADVGSLPGGDVPIACCTDQPRSFLWQHLSSRLPPSIPPAQPRTRIDAVLIPLGIGPESSTSANPARLVVWNTLERTVASRWMKGRYLRLDQELVSNQRCTRIDLSWSPTVCRCARLPTP